MMTSEIDAARAPVLQLRDVRRSYVTGDRTLNVLNGVDLVIRPGEIVGLVGPSGSGKSTLLHTAGLLERPESGEVLLDGRSCSPLSEDERTRLRRDKLGFVYQFHHLLPEFSALDNVAMPLMIAGRKRRDARERAEELLVLMGLSERLSHQPGQLSGGEQQRVAIARALANSPRLVIADEPTGNLDPTITERVFATLLELSEKQGVSILVATHNFSLIEHMDFALTLRDGKLTAFDK